MQTRRWICLMLTIRYHWLDTSAAINMVTGRSYTDLILLTVLSVSRAATSILKARINTYFPANPSDRIGTTRLRLISSRVCGITATTEIRWMFTKVMGMWLKAISRPWEIISGI